MVSIMKMVLFLFVSTALHAAALAYPALFLDSRVAAPVIVTLVDADGESSNGPAGGGAQPQKKLVHAARKAAVESRQETPFVAPERNVVRSEEVVELPQTLSAPRVALDVPGGIIIAARQSESVVETPVRSGGAVKNVSALGGGGNGVGDGAGTRAGGNGGGGSGAGGQGIGSGAGEGGGSGAVLSVKASYADCPKPDYPDRARREGWEGTVTLRVLVDEEGKSKSLEVNRSSGFPVLDEAAMDNVKRRCRFNPARDGDRRMESWIRIPVVFRLADIKAR
jgi:TonB family protein